MSSIGGLDPLADVYNQLGVQGMFGQNPYLQYQGKIPMAGYQGTPTDASGNPIQSFLDAQTAHDAWDKANPAPAAPAQGTTLNSISPYTIAKGNPAIDAGNQAAGLDALGSLLPTGGGSYAAGPGTPPGFWQATQGQQQQAPAPAAPTNPIDMRQAYLSALANPGKMTTPGAQMLPGTSPTGPVGSTPSVLTQFLTQHPSGGAQMAGGGYSNKGFFDTLNSLKRST